jgi:hypothetical protein
MSSHPAGARFDPRLRFARCTASGLTLALRREEARAGDPRSPLRPLLHGFPQTHAI